MRFVRSERFKDAYCRLDRTTAAKADKALALLASNPRHPSLHLKRIRSTPDLWEVRVDRGHRMTLQIEGDCYVMRNIGKHDETLGNP